jgi:glucose-1-phosphate cytidylyltransferase
MTEQELTKHQVVILCGGQGTRIRAVAEDRPKPMVEIGDRPILWHIMKIYAHYGIKRFILALGHQGDKIVEYFETYTKRYIDSSLRFSADGTRLQHHRGVAPELDISDWEITFAHTGLPTNTGGRLARIRPYVDQDDFFCTYGDGVSDVDIASVFARHRATSNIGTVVAVHLPTTFGVIDADESGQIRSFREKPVLPGFINGGFFCFKREIFDYIDGDSTILESDSFRRVAQTGRLGMFAHEGFWHAMDHYKDYVALNDLWHRNQAPWKIW